MLSASDYLMAAKLLRDPSEMNTSIFLAPDLRLIGRVEILHLAIKQLASLIPSVPNEPVTRKCGVSHMISGSNI